MLLKKLHLLLVFISCLPFGFCAAQTGEHFHALKLGVQTGDYVRMEAGYFFGIEKGLGSEGAAEVFGPAASLELWMRSAEEGHVRNIVGFKAGFDYYRWLPFGCRMNMAYYTNGKMDSFQLAPEAGLTFDGIVSVFAGVNVPLTHPDLLSKEKGHITVMIHLPFLYKTFYDDRPPVKDGWWVK